MPAINQDIEGFVVRMEGLEPPRLTAPDPKSGTATNYATSAFVWSVNIRSCLAATFPFPFYDPKFTCGTRNEVANL